MIKNCCTFFQEACTAAKVEIYDQATGKEQVLFMSCIELSLCGISCLKYFRKL